MENDKREQQSPVPDNVDEYLTEAQQFALTQIEGFGWELAFVRRPLFQETTAVLRNSNGMVVGVLEPDGNIEKNPEIQIRE